MSPPGYLTIILHSHLPFVRHPEYEDSLEERWLFEAITESYIPLLLILEKLVRDRINFRVTLTFTPTLVTMLCDSLLQARYLRRLDSLIELAEKEIMRTNKLSPQFYELAYMYYKKFLKVRDYFLENGMNIIKAFKRLQDSGHIEIMASAATHAFLPLLAVDPSGVFTQIRVGAEHYRNVFDRDPSGFWLPECGYYPGIDDLLRMEGIWYPPQNT